MSENQPTVKVCTKCNACKPLDDFYNRKTGRYGKSSQCKMCVKVPADKKAEYNKKWREANPIEKRISNTRGFARQIDTNRGVFNTDTFIKPAEVRRLLSESKCRTCESELKDNFYLDSYDRKLGHMSGNCFISCGSCLRKRDTEQADSIRDTAVDYIFGRLDLNENEMKE